VHVRAATDRPLDVDKNVLRYHIIDATDTCDDAQSINNVMELSNTKIGGGVYFAPAAHWEH